MWDDLPVNSALNPRQVAPKTIVLNSCRHTDLYSAFRSVRESPAARFPRDHGGQHYQRGGGRRQQPDRAQVTTRISTSAAAIPHSLAGQRERIGSRSHVYHQHARDLSHGGDSVRARLILAGLPDRAAGFGE